METILLFIYPLGWLAGFIFLLWWVTKDNQRNHINATGFDILICATIAIIWWAVFITAAICWVWERNKRNKKL